MQKHGIISRNLFASRITQALFMCCWLLSAIATAQDANFRYRFEIGRPLLYKVSENSTTTMKFEGYPSPLPPETKISQCIQFTLVMKPVAFSNDCAVIQLSCTAIQASWNISMGTNKVDLTLSKSGKIEGIANGKEVETTDDKYRDEIAPLYEQGTISVSSLGKVEILSGNHFFNHYWSRWERLIPLQFPPSWNGIDHEWSRICPVQLDLAGNAPASFSSFSETLITKLVKEYITGQDTCSIFRIKGHGIDLDWKSRSSPEMRFISPAENNTTGTIIFNKTKGRTISSKSNHDVHVSYEYKTYQRYMTLQVDCKRTIETSLIDKVAGGNNERFHMQ